MTSRRATPNSHERRGAACACGLAFAGPWDLIAHFLAVYPPDADEPQDDKRHADVTSLAAKLAEGPTEAWDFIPWSLDPRKHRRVAASIAMKAATGELEKYEELSYQKVRDTYQASTYVTRNALSELQDLGIVNNWGGRINVAPRDWFQARDAPRRDARILDLITIHVTNLEAEVSALTVTTGRSGLAGEETTRQ